MKSMKMKWMPTPIVRPENQFERKGDYANDEPK
jgi:hypothetical protein